MRQFSAFGRLINRVIIGHLRWIARMSSSYPRQLLAAAGLLLLLSGLSISRVRFETDIFRLFPTERPALKLLLESLEWSGGAREAYFLLEGQAPLLQSEAERFAVRLKTLQVDGKPAFKRVLYRVFEESEAGAMANLIRFAAAHPAAFVAPEQADQLLGRLTPQSIAAALQHLAVKLATSLGSAPQLLALADPLELGPLFLPRLQAGSQALSLATDSPYFQSRDGRVLIMIAEPAQPVQEMAFARKLVAAVNTARQDSKVSISCAGAHISAVVDEAAMKTTILASIVSSLVVVLGLFFGIYRRLLPTLMIPLILATGVVLALGTAGLFLTSIHIISFAFMALIIGLGTDYSIHLYDRFHQERAGGIPTDQAIQLALVDTGHGLFTAAATTAVPFLTLGFSNVRALSELGILVGLGVLFSLYATLLFMPPVLLHVDRHAATYRPLPALGLDRVWRFSQQATRPLFVGALLLVVGLTGAATQIRFDNDLKNLQPRHSEAFKAQELVEQHLNLAPKSLLVAVDGRDPAAVLQRSAAVDQLARQLMQQGRLQAWSSLGQAVNLPVEQAILIRQLQRAGAVDNIHQVVKNELLKQGFMSSSFDDYLKQLAAGSLLQSVPEQELVRQLAASPLRSVVERHLVQDAHGWHSLTYLFYQPGRLKLAQFEQELARAVPSARLTGTELVSQELLEGVRQSFVSSFFYGGALVLVLLLAHFRSLAGLVAALGPVLVGAIAMLGTMVLCGMKLNFMNAMVLVTIVGMGSDYGLHIQHRLADMPADEQCARFVQAGRAVLLSALTTIAGFGSLAFADYGAMSSIGWATNFGIGFTALAALVLLPAALSRIAIRR